MADVFQISEGGLFISDGLVLKVDAAQRIFDNLTAAQFKVKWDKTEEFTLNNQAVTVLLFDGDDLVAIKKHLRALNRPTKGTATTVAKKPAKKAVAGPKGKRKPKT